jgi:hypothetical protein
VENLAPTGIFLYSLVLHPYLLLFFDFLHFVFTAQQTHNPNFHSSGGIFYVLSLCTLSVFLCPDCPGFCLFVFTVQQTHNTNIHAPGGIQTRNPTKRSATYPCIIPLGQWDRLDSISGPFSS